MMIFIGAISFFVFFSGNQNAKCESVQLWTRTKMDIVIAFVSFIEVLV